MSILTLVLVSIILTIAHIILSLHKFTLCKIEELVAKNAAQARGAGHCPDHPGRLSGTSADTSRKVLTPKVLRLAVPSALRRASAILHGSLQGLGFWQLTLGDSWTTFQTILRGGHPVCFERLYRK